MHITIKTTTLIKNSGMISNSYSFKQFFTHPHTAESCLKSYLKKNNSQLRLKWQTFQTLKWDSDQSAYCRHDSLEQLLWSAAACQSSMQSEAYQCKGHSLSTGGSDYKVKLSSISSNIFERSRCLHNRSASRITCKRIVIGKWIRTTLCKTQFKKLYSTFLSGARKLLVPRSHLHGKC